MISAVENLKRDGRDTYVHKTLKRKTTEIHDPLPDSKQRYTANFVEITIYFCIITLE